MLDGSFALPIVDIIIVVLLLIFVFVGVKKGFIKSIFGLIGTLASFVIALFLCNAFVNLVDSIVPVKQPLFSSISGWFSNLATVDVPDTIEGITVKLTEAGLPQFLIEPLSQVIFSAVDTLGIKGVNFQELLTNVVGTAILSVVAEFVLFLIIRIALFFAEKLLENTLLKIPPVKQFDKLLGGALGLIKGVICVMIIFTLLSFIFVSPVGASETSFLTVMSNLITDSYIGNLLLNVSKPIAGWVIANMNIQKIMESLLSGGESVAAFIV